MHADPPPLTFTYTNWRGETAQRRACPLDGETEFCVRCGGLREFYVGRGRIARCGACRGTGQRLGWLLVAWDLDRGAMRRFAVERINVLRGSGASPQTGQG